MTVLLLNPVDFFISKLPRWSCGNVLYHSCTSFEGASRSCISFEGASRGDQTLNIFTSSIGAGGRRAVWDGKRKACFSPSRIVTFLPVQKSFEPAGPKCNVFREGCDQKRNKLKKNIFVCESVTFLTNVTRHIFLSPKKVTNVTSLTQIWDGKLGRNLGKTNTQILYYCIDRDTVQKHTHTHTHIHTHIHTHTRTRTHTHTHAHARTRTHTHTHIHTFSLTHCLSHTHTYPHTHGLTHVDSILVQCCDV